MKLLNVTFSHYEKQVEEVRFAKSVSLCITHQLKLHCKLRAIQYRGFLQGEEVTIILRERLSVEPEAKTT